MEAFELIPEPHPRAHERGIGGNDLSQRWLSHHPPDEEARKLSWRYRLLHAVPDLLRAVVTSIVCKSRKSTPERARAHLATVLLFHCFMGQPLRHYTLLQ